MYCTECGTELQTGASFCTDCGSKVGVAPESSAGETVGRASSPESTTAIGQTKNNLSTLSLVLGISSAFFFEFVFIPIAAVIASSLSLAKANQLSRTGVLRTEKGVSIAGLVLGVIYSLLGFYYLLLW